MVKDNNITPTCSIGVICSREVFLISSLSLSFTHLLYLDSNLFHYFCKKILVEYHNFFGIRG